MTTGSSASRRFLFVALLQFLITINYYCRAKVTCEQTAGRNSMGPTCEGDYCMYAELPGIEKPVRGCLNGELMKNNIPDQCEQSIDNRNVCICSKDGCNVNANGIKKEKVKLLECYQCEKNCSKQTFCYGEYCVVTRYSKNRIVRGCSNPSMPLFERKGLGSCVTPSFPSHTEDRNWDESTLSAVTCMCNDRKFCNGVDLSKKIEAGSQLKKCRVRAYASTKLGTHPSPSVPECMGEHCFNILVELGGVTSNVSGCLSYHDFGKDGDRKPPQHEELNDRGCMTIHSDTLRAKACFDTDELRENDDDESGGGDDKKADFEAGDEAPKSREPEYAKNEKNGEKTGKNRQKTGKSDKSRAHQLAKNKTPKERQSASNPDEDGGEKKEKESQQAAEEVDKPKPSHFIHGDVDPDNPVLKPESEGNTAIVAVFVAIMVLIVIAGVVWKFELHKKIFHARYQTVAG